MLGALQISSKFLKLLVLQKKKETIFQIAKVSVDLPKGAIEKGKVKNEKLFLDKLKELRQKAKSSKAKISEIMVCIPDEQVYSEVHYFPQTSSDGISDVVELNAPSIFPQDIQSLYFDWQEVSKISTESLPSLGVIDNINIPKVGILISSSDKVVIDTYLKNLKEAGFLTFALEGTIFSTARTSGGAPVLIFQIFGKEATLGVSNSGLPYFFKTLKIEDLAREDFYLKEIEKVLDFSQTSSLISGPVSKILLCGQGDLKKIKDKISLNTKIPVEIFKNFPVSASSLDTSDAAVLGLGLRTLINPKSDFNLSLLPLGTSESNQIQKTLNFFGLLRTSILVSAISLFVIYAAFFLFLIFLSRNLSTQLLSTSLIPIGKDTMELQNKVSEFNQQVLILRQLEEQNQYLHPVFSQVENAKVDGVGILQISLSSQKEISLSGTADGQSNLLSYKGNLENSGAFQNVQIPLSSVSSDGKVSFTLKLAIKNEALKKKVSE